MSEKLTLQGLETFKDEVVSHFSLKGHKHSNYATIEDLGKINTDDGNIPNSDIDTVFNDGAATEDVPAEFYTKSETDILIQNAKNEEDAKIAQRALSVDNVLAVNGNVPLHALTEDDIYSYEAIPTTTTKTISATITGENLWEDYYPFFGSIYNLPTIEPIKEISITATAPDSEPVVLNFETIYEGKYLNLVCNIEDETIYFDDASSYILSQLFSWAEDPTDIPFFNLNVSIVFYDYIINESGYVIAKDSYKTKVPESTGFVSPNGISSIKFTVGNEEFEVDTPSYDYNSVRSSSNDIVDAAFGSQISNIREERKVTDLGGFTKISELSIISFPSITKNDLKIFAEGVPVSEINAPITAGSLWQIYGSKYRKRFTINNCQVSSDARFLNDINLISIEGTDTFYINFSNSDDGTSPKDLVGNCDMLINFYYTDGEFYQSSTGHYFYNNNKIRCYFNSGIDAQNVGAIEITIGERYNGPV